MRRPENLIFFVKFCDGPSRGVIAAPSRGLKIEEARAPAVAFSQLQSQLPPCGIIAAPPRGNLTAGPCGAAPVKSQLPTAIYIGHYPQCVAAANGCSRTDVRWKNLTVMVKSGRPGQGWTRAEPGREHARKQKGSHSGESFCKGGSIEK